MAIGVGTQVVNNWKILVNVVKGWPLKVCIYIENVTFSRFWTCGPIHEKKAKV